jgi:uncharacterized protein (TIGR03905 family)
MKNVSFRGTCASGASYEIVDGVITACKIHGGCPGNTQAVARLVVGRRVEEVVPCLKGIVCRMGTSCPDQLAQALEAEL